MTNITRILAPSQTGNRLVTAYCVASHGLALNLRGLKLKRPASGGSAHRAASVSYGLFLYI